MKKNEKFVPMEELAEHFSVSVSTIRSWIRKGHIPPHAFVKAGPTYRFKISDVTDALRVRKPVKTVGCDVQKEAEEKVSSYLADKVEPTSIEELFDEDM
jgi:excisionase family DNA binding protein